MSHKLKIGHIADIHAGYRSSRHTDKNGVNIRELDGYHALEACIDDMIEQEIDVTIWGGDAFHSPFPTIRSIFEVQKQLRKLSAAGIKSYILAGNHDASDVKADIAANKILDDDMRGIYSHVEPYAYHEIADGVHVHLVSHHMYNEQHATMARVKPIPGEINIFTTHGSVVNPLDNTVLHTESSPREIVVPEFLINDRDWSYSMFGHIHTRGWVGSKDTVSDTSGKKIFYNGSLIRRGYSDPESPLGRGWTLWTVSEDGLFTPEFRTIWQRPQFDFNVLDASNLSSQQLSEKIIDNLRMTQTDNSKVLDINTAPILRQRVVNLSPSKRSALDWSAISKEAGHSFQWSLKQISTQDVDNSLSSKESKLDMSPFERKKDIVEEFKDWVKTSQKVLSIEDEESRKSVIDKTESFIVKGQDEAYENED